MGVSEVEADAVQERQAEARSIIDIRR